MSSVYNEEVKGTGTGNFFKWETVGQEFEGVFLRIQQNVNKRQPDRPLFAGIFRKLDTGAEISVNAPTELLNKLQSVQPGTQLFIRYTGQAPSARGGMPRKTFQVFKAGTGVAPAPAGNGYATVPQTQPIQQPQVQVPAPPPQAPQVPSVPSAPVALTVPYLMTLLAKHAGESSAKLTATVLAGQPESEQIRMLSETLTRNYGEKL